MYEITHDGNRKLQEYIAKDIACEDGEYDFTYEHRYLIYHAPLMREWYYFVLDMITDNSSVS